MKSKGFLCNLKITIKTKYYRQQNKFNLRLQMYWVDRHGHGYIELFLVPASQRHHLLWGNRFLKIILCWKVIFFKITKAIYLRSRKCLHLIVYQMSKNN